MPSTKSAAAEKSAQPKKSRRQLEQERAEAARLQREAELKAWRELLPHRMLALMAMARPVVHRVEVKGVATAEAVKAGDLSGLKLSINFDGGRDEDVIGMDVEPWEFDSMVARVQMAIDERAAAEEKLRLARETYDNLTPAQRDALGLKYRP